jgi:hypothetical protein
MMLKKGLSHIEFVISFVIFIGFIVFAFLFFNPLESQRTLRSTMDYAWIEIGQEAKERVETYSVSIDSTITAPTIAIDIASVPSGYIGSVEDPNGTPIDSYTDTRGVHFDRSDDTFFRIKYSPAILNNPTPINGLILLEDEYYVSSSKIEDLYFERFLLDLNDTYYTNYSGLKQTLNLPNRMEFGFVVKFSNGEISAMRPIPDNAEVLSRSDRIEIIRNSGRREYADLMVRVW